VRRGWLLSAIVVVVFGFVWLRSGGQIPIPQNAQTTAAGDLRIPVSMVSVPPNSSGEAWNLGKGDGGTYYVNLYLNGRAKHIFATRSSATQSSQGASYQTAGIVQFNQQKYHATTIFVQTNGKSGYIEFAKS
jgi:hypothetical protein